MKTFLTIAILASPLYGEIFAQWIPDPSINNPVVLVANKGTTEISEMVSATDGNGGMFIAWIDTRNSNTTGSDIYVTRLLNTGAIAPGFSAGGNLICQAVGDQSTLHITGDGIDGVVVAWKDPRNIGPNKSDIYAQRINGSGSILWTTDGVAIATGTNDENTPVLELTSNNRVAVAWRQEMPGMLGTDLFANFLNLSNGSKILGTDISVVSKNNTQSEQRILRDGIGGFMIIWTDGRLSDNNLLLYAQRIDQNGSLLWGPSGNEADGQLIINSNGNVLLPQMDSDGEGGFVVAFASTRISQTDANIYAQKVSSNGIPQWTTDGVNVCVASSSQSNVRIVKSGPSSYVIGWADRRNSTDGPLTNSVDIYAQALDQGGNIKWALDGLPVVLSMGSQPLNPLNGFEIMDDQIGGAYFIWDDSRNGNSDVYSQRKLFNGSDGWQTNGVPIANLSGSAQNWPKIVRSGDRLVIAWRDSRAASNAEIYATQLLSDGVLPVEILELTARPNGKNVLVEWTSKNEKVLSHFEVERSNDGIIFNLAGKANARNTAGTFKYSFEDGKPTVGNSFYRIKSVDIDGSFALSNIARISFEMISPNNVHLYPNPAFTTFNLQLNELPNGQYSVRVIDLQGRTIISQQVGIISSFQNVQIPVNRISGGLYKVQVINDKGERIAQQSLIKQ